MFKINPVLICVVFTIVSSVALAMWDDGLLEALEKVEQETGKPNALVYYVKAIDHPAIVGAGKFESLISETIEEGWSADSDELIVLLNSYQEAFELVRKGTQLSHAEFPDPSTFGIYLPIISPKALFLAWMLCVEGKRKESRNDINNALEDYVTVLKMARHLQDKNAIAIDYLLGTGSKERSIIALNGLIAKGKPDASVLAKMIRELKTIRGNPPSLVQCLQCECRAIRAEIDEKVDIAAKGELPKDWESLWKTPQQLLSICEQIAANKDQILAVWSEKYLNAKALIETLPWNRDVKGYRENKKKLDSEIGKLDGSGQPAYTVDWADAADRNESQQALIGLVLVKAALELCRLENDAYPDSLDVLTPKILPELPLDPFSGKSFEYQKTPAGYTLYSLGPDCISQGGQTVYDFKKGDFREGDIVLP